MTKIIDFLDWAFDKTGQFVFTCFCAVLATLYGFGVACFSFFILLFVCAAIGVAVQAIFF